MRSGNQKEILVIENMSTVQARVAEELIDYDPNCIKTKDRGREVFKCRSMKDPSFVDF